MNEPTANQLLLEDYFKKERAKDSSIGLWDQEVEILARIQFIEDGHPENTESLR